MLNEIKNRIIPLIRRNSYKKRSCSSFYSTCVTKPKEEKIQIRDWNINYVTVGTGPHHVLCLPGALGTIWTDFKPQVEGFNREKFTLVVWDPPGYGKSRPPLRDFPANLYERDAEWAFEFMQALNINKYSVLGWSDGGSSALIFAAKYPQVMEKLVITAANSFILPHELKFYKSIRDTKAWSKKMLQPMVEVYGEELLAQYWSDWVDGMERVYNAKGGNICSDLLKDIKCPTMVLYGQKDPIVDSVHISHLHTNIEGSVIHLYPDGKHNLHLAYPDDFNQRVQEFLLGPSKKIK